MGDPPPHTSRAAAVSAGDLEAEKAAAFARARRKFAVYGRRPLPPAAPATTSDAAAKLKTTLLLQENGELALRLDDLAYRLDGALAASGDGDAVAAAQNVAALARLLLLAPAQLALQLAPASQQVHTRLRAVLRLLAVDANCHSHATEEREAGDALAFAVAALAFVLTLSTSAEEVFLPDIIDLVVVRMRCEVEPAEVTDAASMSERPRVSTAVGADADADAHAPLRKTCLKRRLTAPNRRRSSSGSGEDLVESMPPSSLSPGEVNTSLIDQLVADIMRLLADHDVFCVDGQQLQASVGDVLAVVLHNLLQIDRGQDERCRGARASKNQLSTTITRDLAGVTFANVLNRKRRLVENRGLDVLVLTLSARFQHLKQCFLDGDERAASARERVQALWRLQIVLQVLDQASFLAAPVQQLLSANADLFAILLESVDQLSDLTWGVRQSELAASDAAFVHLMAEVLLASMRVLINLTHHNEAAAHQIYSIQGTNVLFRTFCRLGGYTETSKAPVSPPLAVNVTFSSELEDKVLFDALLMNLSALTNCVEFSEENRQALSSLSAPASAIGDLTVAKTSNLCACELFAHFFLRKAQSYMHLIETNDSHDGEIDRAQSAHWVPEDVILGGCTSLLLGCLMKNSRANALVVMDVLPDGSPRLLLRALSAFVALHSQIGALTPEVGASVLQVEQTLKSFDRDSNTFCNEPDAPPSTVSVELKIAIAVESTKQDRPTVLSCDTSSDVHRTEDVMHNQKQSEVHTPPAAAFKLQWRKKVCSTVDSDTEEGGDTETTAAAADTARTTEAATPTKRTPKAPRGRSPITRSPRVRSPGVRTPSKIARTVSASTLDTPAALRLTSSANRGSNDRDRTPKQTQTETFPSRVKRSRQLGTDLAEKLAQVSDDKPAERAIVANAVSLEARSKERENISSSDIFDQLDFSRDKTVHTSIPSTTTTTSPARRLLSRDSSPMTPGMRKRARVSRLQAAQKSPSRRPPLSAALASADKHTESQRTAITLEEASSSNNRSAVMLLTRSPSLDGALKRKPKAARPPLPSLQSQQVSSSYSSSTAVFDFDDA